MSNRPLKRIAVLGTGIMGAAVAINLQKNGFEVNVWNRTKEKSDKLKSYGITAFDTAQEAVQSSDAIITFLKDGPTVLKVMQSIAKELTNSMIWLQMSTVGLFIDHLIDFSNSHNLTFYDIPVQGTKQPAEQGQLTLMVSSTQTDDNKLTPIFDAIGKQTFWISDKPGASSRLKLALNSWVATLTHGVAESLTLAQGLDLDPQWVIDIISGGPMDSLYFQQKSKAVVENDYTTNFSVNNALKDSEIVLEAAKKEELQLDIAKAGLERYLRAVKKGYGDKDMTASALVSKL